MDQKNITASVKWFKSDKGYGFVRFSDGSGEAFLHSSVLAPLGLTALTDGTVIVCDIAAGQKGPQVAAIHRIEEAPPAEAAPQARGRRRGKAAGPAREGAPAEPRPPREPREQPAREVERAPAGELMFGSIRWYNVDSQSGLIDPADGGESIYFDRATLRQSRLDIVADGEDVWFTARDTADGPVADRVELAQRRAE